MTKERLPDPNRLRRELGLVDAVAIGLGAVIGVGIVYLHRYKISKLQYYTDGMQYEVEFIHKKEAYNKKGKATIKNLRDWFRKWKYIVKKYKCLSFKSIDKDCHQPRA